MSASRTSSWVRPFDFTPSTLALRVWAVGLAVNALDLTSSWEGGRIRVASVIASRSPAAWAIQLALLVPLALRLPSYVRVAREWVGSLPIPRLPRALIVGVVVTQLAHVALRAECYPFSPIAMFSDVAPDPGARPRFERIYLVRGHRVNFLRESSLLFAEHDLALDVKAAWLLRINATGLGRAYGVIADAFVAQGDAPPLIAEVRYATGSGRITDARVLGVPRGYVTTRSAPR